LNIAIVSHGFRESAKAISKTARHCRRSNAAARGYNAHAIAHLSSLWRAIRGAAIDPNDPNYAVSGTIEKIGGAKPKMFEAFVREGQGELLAKSA